MNDVQRPIRVDGKWHLYNLVNSDYPRGNGTSWRHFTSVDLVSWNDEGIAIEKYRDGLGDIETGSVIVDETGTAGFGAGALIAIVTQQADGVQQQSLFGSTDGGHRFAPHPANPIMPNPGAPDFRDPKIVRDPASHTWIMALAEGHRIGFYTSADLVTWTYCSDFPRDDLGTLECPDLFQIGIDGDPSAPRWVLAASGNGARYGRETGVVYWVGDWDGTRFTADGGAYAAPRWLDDGPDFYAGVTWADESAPDAVRLASRYAMGWVSNWAYAQDVRLPEGGAGGPDSIVRTLRLASTSDGAVLQVSPLGRLRNVETGHVRREVAAVRGGTSLLTAPAPPYRVRVTIDGGDASEAQLQLPGGMTVSVDRGKATLSAYRERDDRAARMPASYRSPATMQLGEGRRVDLDILVDESTIEIFYAGKVMSLLTTPRAGQIAIDAFGGSIGRVVAECAALR
jgi:levanbiose-producing levanase